MLSLGWQSSVHSVVVELSLKTRISVAGDKAVVVVVFDGVTGSC